MNETIPLAAAILLVEDEAIVALDLREQLSDMGYRVVGVAGTADEAVRLAQVEKPDLILMDIVLRGAGDGISAAEQVRRQFNTPIIFLTAYSDLATVQRAARVAPYGYLTKPFQVNELRAAIEVALVKAGLEKRLRESEQWFASTLHCVADAVIATDGEGRVRFMNPVAERLLGMSHEQALGQALESRLQFFERGTGKPLESPVSRALAHDAVTAMAFGTELHGPAGSLPIDDSAAPIHDGEGHLLGAVLVFRDVSARLAIEDQLRANEAQFRNVFDFAPLGMALVSLDGRFLRVNAALCNLFGRAAPFLTGLNMAALAYPDPADSAPMLLADLLAGNLVTVQFERRFRRADGQPVPTLANVALLNRGAQPMCYLWQLHDLTERKEYEQRLARLANYDPLTGLANRARLGEEMAHQIAVARRHASRMGVVFIDLDHFKQVNDTLGHETGDALLREIAQRLSAAVRSIDTVARLGGDEFVVLLPELHHPEDVLHVTDKLRAACNTPVVVAGHELYAGMSLGVSIFPDDGGDERTLLSHADSALYHAKSEGRGNLQFYKGELMARVQRRVELENGLRQALGRNEFELYYQPVVDLRTGRPRMAEALLRWRPNSGALRMPDEFITVAADMGLMPHIGRWVLETACRFAASWSDGQDGPLGIAVNVSPRQFKLGQVLADVQHALSASGIAAHRLCVEITEEVFLDPSLANLNTLEKLKQMGVRIAIDDFGTGYSSLSYVSRLAPHKLKIDRSLVQDVTSSSAGAAVVHAVVAMGRALDLEVVTEGVETAEQGAFLMTAGCTLAQGFRYATPMPEASCRSWLNEHINASSRNLSN